MRRSINISHTDTNTTHKPLIGVSLDYCDAKTYSNYAPWYALRCNYTEAIQAAGGTAIMLPYDQDAIHHYLKLVDGLVVPGGDYDIDPKYYQQNSSSKLRQLNEKRFAFESELLGNALTHNKPVLGICAGMQLMNVICGGTLLQDISDTEIAHECPDPHQQPAHDIAIEPDSRLHTITQCERFAVNSTHHQAIDQLGEGLKQSAYADDNIIEAIELIDHPFAIGVEWHPEYTLTNYDKLIWQHFIKAAMKRD